MNLPGDWKIRYDAELSHAISARANGNEGMARVCARRAASIVIGEYLSRRGHLYLSASIYDRLAIFITMADVDEECKHIATRFLMKVGQDHNLPVNADLISDVEWLVKKLLIEDNA